MSVRMDASCEPAEMMVLGFLNADVPSAIALGGAAATDLLEYENPDLSSELDLICRCASRRLDVPLAFATVVDSSEVRLVGRWGTELVDVPRAQAFCDHTMRLPAGEALVVRDLTRDPRFADYALVAQEPHLRFYAGVHLTLANGERIGTFCVADRVPRPNFGALDLVEFRNLARSVEARLRLREAQLGSEALERERLCAEAVAAMKERAQRAVDRANSMAEAVAGFGIWRIDLVDMTVTWSVGLAGIFGRAKPDGVLGGERHQTKP